MRWIRERPPDPPLCPLQLSLGLRAAATEQCLLDLVRGWRMPFAGAGATITIPISFTRGT